MHRQIAILVVALVGLGSAVVAQKSEADVKALTQQYEQAFNKGDVTGFEGPINGARLLRPGRTQNLPGDLILAEGSYQLTGAADAPPSGRYLNTIVRENGQWRLASVAILPDTSKMAKPAGTAKPQASRR